MHADLQRVLIDRATLARRVAELADEIGTRLSRLGGGGPAGGDRAGPGEVTLVPVLTGSIIFVADLIRHLPIQMQIHLMSVSSYPGTSTTSQGVTMNHALSGVPDDLAGLHVLLIDDILDSGATITAVRAELESRGPDSLHTAVLLRKERHDLVQPEVDFVAFDIPDAFVVGYGLDFDDYYRNLPEIGVLRDDVIARARADAGQPGAGPAGAGQGADAS